MAGVLMPDWASSVSLSDTLDALSGGIGEGVARWRLMRGGSESLRRAAEKLGRLSCGGGDRRRGETGHRGLSLAGVSEFDGYFWGPVSLPSGSDEAGRRLGVVAAERILEGVWRGMWDRGVLAGLVSWWLFLLDRETAGGALVDDVDRT